MARKILALVGLATTPYITYLVSSAVWQSKQDLVLRLALVAVVVIWGVGNFVDDALRLAGERP